MEAIWGSSPLSRMRRVASLGVLRKPDGLRTECVCGQFLHKRFVVGGCCTSVMVTLARTPTVKASSYLISSLSRNCLLSGVFSCSGRSGRAFLVVCVCRGVSVCGVGRGLLLSLCLWVVIHCGILGTGDFRIRGDRVWD